MKDKKQQPTVSEGVINLISKAESDYIVLKKKDGIYDLVPMKPFDDWANIHATPIKPTVSEEWCNCASDYICGICWERKGFRFIDGKLTPPTPEEKI